MNEHVNADVGRIVPLFRGEYSAASEYELNDIVKYGDNLYWHVSKETTSGIVPTDTDTWALVLMPSMVSIDATLSIAGKAADAKAVGDALPISDSGEGYTKLPDGTLIQWGGGIVPETTEHSVEASVTFPIAFIGTPTIVPLVKTRYPNNYAVGVNGDDISSTGCIITFYRSQTTAGRVVYAWQAIGRWKEV